MSTPVSAQGSYDMGIAQLRNEIAAKDAEIERLQSYIRVLIDKDKAAAEVERLQAAEQTAIGNFDNLALEYGKLKVEIERLTLVDREGVWSVRAVKAEQENERLRAALSVSQANLNIAKANLHNERTAMKARRVLEGK